MLDGLIENKTNAKQRDAAFLCGRAVNISEWLSCILLASTLFFGQAPQREIACHREEIVVRATLLPPA